jgi:hypothetical protein
LIINESYIFVEEFLYGIEPSVRTGVFEIEITGVSTASNYSESEEVLIFSVNSGSLFSSFPTGIELTCQE